MDNSDAVRALRKKLGWTQRRLASELRKSEHTVKRWEMGIREPSPEILEKLAALASGRLSRFFAERVGLPRKLVRKEPAFYEASRKGLVYLHVQEGLAEQIDALRPQAQGEEREDARRHQLLAKVLRSGNRKAIEAVTKTLEAFVDAPRGKANRRKAS